MSSQSKSWAKRYPYDALHELWWRFFESKKFLELPDGKATSHMAILEQLSLSVVSSEYFGYHIDADHIIRFERELYDVLKWDPEGCLTVAEDVANEIVIEAHPGFSDIGEGIAVDYPHAVVRVYNWENSVEDGEIRTVASLRPADIDTLLTLRVMVMKSSKVRSEVILTEWVCERCHANFKVEIDDGNVEEMGKPLECREDEGGCGKTRSSTNFKENSKKRERREIQHLTVQDCPDELTETPQRIKAQVRCDMAGIVEDGVRYEVTAIVRAQDIIHNRRPTGIEELYLYVVDIIPLDEIEIDPEPLPEDLVMFEAWKEGGTPILDKVAAAIAPNLHELQHAKVALSVQIVGGIARYDSTGTRVRGDVHIMFVGDPGTGKSALAKAIKGLRAKIILTNGPFASRAGLVASALGGSDRDRDDPAPEPGIMVYANGGILEIEEADKMSREDIQSLNYTLSDQVVVLDKARAHAKWVSRFGALLILNPKTGRFTYDGDILKQTDMPVETLNRIDISVVFRDYIDPDRDRKMADSMLEDEMRAEREVVITEDPVITRRVLRVYFDYVRRTFQPKLTQEAKLEILEEYLHIRGRYMSTGSVQINLRSLRSIHRLCQAIARIEQCHEIRMEHVTRAFNLYRMGEEALMLNADGMVDIDKIETGMSHDMVERMRSLIGVISDLEPHYPKGVPGSGMLEPMVGLFKNYNKRLLSSDLKRMLNEGYVYYAGEDGTDKLYKLWQTTEL